MCAYLFYFALKRSLLGQFSFHLISYLGRTSVLLFTPLFHHHITHGKQLTVDNPLFIPELLITPGGLGLALQSAELTREFTSNIFDPVEIFPCVPNAGFSFSAPVFVAGDAGCFLNKAA